MFGYDTPHKVRLLLDGKRLALRMDTRKTKKVISVLPIFRLAFIFQLTHFFFICNI